MKYSVVCKDMLFSVVVKNNVVCQMKRKKRLPIHVVLFETCTL